MSLDFPKREDWLKVRATKPRQVKVLHVSVPIITFYDESKGLLQHGVRRPGRTDRNPQRAADKIAAKADRKVRAQINRLKAKARRAT